MKEGDIVIAYVNKQFEKNLSVFDLISHGNFILSYASTFVLSKVCFV